MLGISCTTCSDSAKRMLALLSLWLCLVSIQFVSGEDGPPNASMKEPALVATQREAILENGTAKELIEFYKSKRQMCENDWDCPPVQNPCAKVFCLDNVCTPVPDPGLLCDDGT